MKNMEDAVLKMYIFDGFYLAIKKNMVWKTPQNVLKYVRADG